MRWPCCRSCGFTRRSHKALGLCTCCYDEHNYHGTLDQYREAA